jgi:peptidoglycan/xylan/chitin deacetylase (PgdA/CDA1 family)
MKNVIKNALKLITISPFVIILVLVNTPLSAQEKLVAITLDDLFDAFQTVSFDQLEDANESLLQSITTLRVPVTIFVNEHSLETFGDTERTHALYRQWVENPFITIGNHTYSHKNYAQTTFAQFTEDIRKGEILTRPLLEAHGKTLTYFRFPYNCTGKDRDSRTAIYTFLADNGYITTPFTIESLDYVYNRLYCHYLNKGDEHRAQNIITAYLNFTIDIVHYFEELAQEVYGRNIRHIFLGHTNTLHVACFDELIIRLQQQGYTVISLDEALADDIYHHTDYYTEPFGISWMYRWIKDPDVRMAYMKREPFPDDIAVQYKQLRK